MIQAVKRASEIISTGAITPSKRSCQTAGYNQCSNVKAATNRGFQVDGIHLTFCHDVLPIFSRLPSAPTDDIYSSKRQPVLRVAFLCRPAIAVQQSEVKKKKSLKWKFLISISIFTVIVIYI